MSITDSPNKDVQLLYEIINDFVVQNELPIIDLIGIIEVIKIQQVMNSTDIEDEEDEEDC